MLLQAMHKKVQKTKMEQNFNPGLALIGLFRGRLEVGAPSENSLLL